MKTVRKLMIHQSHLITFVVMTALAVIVALMHAVSSDSATEDLEIGLGKALNLHIKPGSVIKIGESQDIGDMTWQEILFLAKDPADLYQTRIKVDHHGQLMDLDTVRNLTNTDAGDDYIIVASGQRAAIATRALGQVRSLTLFDFQGASLPQDDQWTNSSKILARITNLIETGRYHGVGKITIRFKHPPKQVSLGLVEQDGQEHIMAHWIDEEGNQHKAIIDKDNQEDNDELLFIAEVRLPKRPILWAVDTARSFSWIGPGPIEWAEGRFFAIRDSYKRFNYEMNAQGIDEEDAPYDLPESQQVFNMAPGKEVGSKDLPNTWPPSTVKPPVFKRIANGEGTWTPASPEFAQPLPGTPDNIYRTYTRPDRRRPYVKVHLIAMDMRRLDLHMVGGHEDPRPTTGSCGTGRIPRDPKIMPKVKIAFNGAFKTEHGAYGMMVDRNLLLPPQDKAATVATFDDGRVVMGSWPEKQPIPAQMLSLRQNMDPLVENGKVNPRRRYLWGFTLSEDIKEMNTIRSGICISEAGHLVYAWGEDLTADTLGVAMNAAGCQYGMHLDMNPFHTAYIFYKFDEPFEEKRTPKFKSKLAMREMRYSPNRYVNGAPKDFFYLTTKDFGPGRGWTHERLAQPAPAEVPAVFERVENGCKMVAIDMSRTKIVLTPGHVPPDVAPEGIAPYLEDTGTVMVSLRLGAWNESRGQIIEGTTVVPLGSKRATLGVNNDGILSIISWSENQNKLKNAVQGAWLFTQDQDNSNNAVSIGVAGRWLYIGHGPIAPLTEAMTRAEVLQPIMFNAPEGEAIVIRTENGMTDLLKNPVSQIDSSGAMLYLLAGPLQNPQVRLEDRMPLQNPQKRTELTR